MKIKKLNQKGFGHQLIAPVLVMVAVGAIGGYVLTQSHAATLPPNSASPANSVTKFTRVPYPCDTPLPILQLGSQGSCVQSAQYILRHWGGSVGLKVDGLYNADTEAAVKTFQTNYSLAANGVIDTGTWNYIEALLNPSENGTYLSACQNFTINGDSNLTNLTHGQRYDVVVTFKNMGSATWVINITERGPYPEFTGGGLYGAFPNLPGISRGNPIANYGPHTSNDNVAPSGVYYTEFKRASFHTGTFYLGSQLDINYDHVRGTIFGAECTKKIVVN